LRYVICAECGSSNRRGARFCRTCGGVLTMRCTSCGFEIEGDARFCDACGAPVVSGARVEVRKTVTILFVDLAGSTSLQERIDPESARRYIDRLFSLLRDRVNEFGGRVV